MRARSVDCGLGVALVSREYPPHCGGGIGTYARHIAPALAKAGSRVHVVTANAPGEPAQSACGGVTIHRVGAGNGVGVQGARAFARAAAGVVLRLHRDGEVDAAEFAEYEGDGAALVGLRACGGGDRNPLARLGLIVHLHTATEALAALGSIPASRDACDLAEIIAMERASVHGADAVCAPSSFMADWAVESFGLRERPTVIPYAHGDALLARPAPAGERRILHIGRLEARKGVESLARAWRAVAGARPDWSLRCVGADTSGPDGRSMRGVMLEALGPAGASVEFAGELPAQALASELRSAAFCVVPSLWENYPNSCIEAMLHARAVVVSDHGGMREMLGDTDAGATFRAGDDAALAVAMLAFIDEGTERLGERGRAARERVLSVCNPVRVARARLELYRVAIERAGARAARSAVLHPALAPQARWLDVAAEADRDCPGAASARAGGESLEGMDAAARARAALLDCARRRLSPVALYGAGTHTRAIGAALMDPPVEIVAILDDDPTRQGRRLWGYPVAAPAEAARLGVRAVVLSSDSMERRLWERAAPLRAAGIEVIRLYTR